MLHYLAHLAFEKAERMLDIVVSNAEKDNPKVRVIRSRKNTPEEKRKQNKEWRKRKLQRKREERNRTPATNTEDVGNNGGSHVSESTKEKPVSSNAKRPCLSAPLATSLQKVARAFSRLAVMLRMALRDDASGSTLTETSRCRETARQKISHSLKGNVGKELKCDFKELLPEHLEYLSEHSVGSGSYGQCFQAPYRGIDVIVKQMKHSNNPVDREKARKNLFHEAGVITALGDHASLPIIFGVITKSLPMCLVTQFHFVKEQSVTLHQAASTNMITPADSIAIFIEISSTLCYVHLKGYIHNDIKANNVVLDRKSGSEKIHPILIDFGESTKLGLLQGTRKQHPTGRRGKIYLAPEVQNKRLYSVASDIYSLGRMLKVVSSFTGFYPKVQLLVKEATDVNPSDGPTLKDFIQKLAAVKL